MGTGSIDNSIVLDASGKEIQVSAYIAKKLKPSEIVYFKNLVKYDLDTLKAYTETFPNSTIVNAKKNKSKFDRKVRVKVPDDYQRIKEIVSKRAPTLEESKYQEELVKHGGDRKAAALATRPDIVPSSAYKVAQRIESHLTAKNPEWREKLTEAYNPNVYFANIDSMAMGYDPTSGALVKPEITLKANLDMLSLQGFSTKVDEQMADRVKRREIHGGAIQKVLNIQINNYNGESKDV